MMGRPIKTFADMIAPVSLDSFLGEHWGVKPLHIRRPEPDFYAQLLTKTDIDNAISSGGLRFPAIQLAKRGMFYPPEAFTRNIRSGEELFTGVPQLDRLRAEYQAGATISLPAFHRACKPLGDLVADIEADFNHAVHTNIYVTPGNAAGFAPHYDGHDVFILQIAGNKHWTIHAPVIPLPHRSQRFDPRTSESATPLLELDPAPGDMVYLPRGFVHTTSTSARFSIHVTLGITVYTWIELLSEWVQSGRNRPALRRALPPGFATREHLRDALKHELLRMMTELQENSDYDAFLDAFAQRVRSARPRVPGAFDTDVTTPAIADPD